MQWTNQVKRILGLLKLLTNFQASEDKDAKDQKDLPIEVAIPTHAPDVPPPITRDYPARVVVPIETKVQTLLIDELNSYEFWTFGVKVPGPFIRARVGDLLEVNHTNSDQSGMLHNIDFHCVIGPCTPKNVTGNN